MTDASGSRLPSTDVAAEPRATGTLRAVLTIAAKLPTTLSLIAVLLIVGVVSGGLWSPFELSPGWDVFAYGLPAFEEGRWWTPITGTFFVNQPWVYALTFASFWGLAYLEYRRGSRVALAYFGVGQLFAVLGTALILWVFAFTNWPWAQLQAEMLDVGPSGGTFAGVAAAIGLFVTPWRVRAWAVLLSFLFVALVFWGNLADVGHVLAVVLVLSVDRTLRLRRTTVREQRLIAFLALMVLGVIEILALLLPTDGPFGSSASGSGSIWDVALDVVVIGLVANGLRHGRRWAWVISVILAIINLLTGALVLFLIALVGWDEVEDGLEADPTVSLASSTTWLLMFAFLISVRGAFRARRKASLGAKSTPTVDEVKAELRASGGGTLSWMTTWDGNAYFRSSTGMLAYQRRAGVTIVLGDPLGPEDGRAQTIAEFIEATERAALIPAFFSVGEATKNAVPSDWRSVVVADDTIVDLPQLEFTGKRWNSVRTALNKAGREEMTFRLSRLRDETWGVQQQLRAISEMWVGDKGLPEMGFTLGTLDEAADPEVRLALAISPQGDVDGFLSWLPIYGGGGVIRGWTLDLMRRREGGFGSVMEFLIGGSARQFRDEGAQILSLSGAPLTHEYPADAGIIKDLTDRLADALEPVYGFRSLHRFKEKFHPRYETMYLLFRDESDLTRIGAGLTRAFLPDATLRQFAGAGLELVRGKD